MKKVLKYLAFLFLAAILLHFSFKGVKWSDFMDGLKSCNWWWIAASMAIGILAKLICCSVLVGQVPHSTLTV